MVKLVYCIRSKPGLTPEEFSRYWSDVHGPIGARTPGLRIAVLTLGVDDLGRALSFYRGLAPHTADR